MTFDMNKYQTDYKKNKYDRISLEVPKGKKEEIKDFAKGKDMKVNEYIKDLITKDSGIEL